ncbi:MAG: methyltransferase domain-containing protein [Myxococcota bacterium]|nr:methyltransferase domain-containing protein [Myxococcota bacterium]
MRSEPLRWASLYVALLLSGCAALVYEATWGRMLHRVFGVGDLAVATVLAAFFLGLGIGSALGGRWAARLGNPALGYAMLEGLVALWALGSLLVIPRVHSLYAALGAGLSFEALTALRLLLALLVLLPPTVLMGATLPVLVAAVARRPGAADRWQAGATRLYATNTFGAMAGAGAASLWLVPTIGTRATVGLAAALSAAAGAIVYGAWRRPGAAHAPGDELRVREGEASAVVTSQQEAATTAGAGEQQGEAPAPDETTYRSRLAAALAALSGLAALGGEVLWTRALRMIVHGTTPAFGAMLVCYLAGIAGGSLLAERLARTRSPLRLLAGLQVLLGLLTACAMMLCPQLVRLMGLLHGAAMLEPHQTGVILVLAALLLLPLSFALGTAVPLCWRIAGGSGHQAARAAGHVLAANTLGGLLGALGAGFLLVPLVGLEASLLLVACVHLLTGAIAYRASVGRRLLPRLLAVAVPALAAAVVFVVRPSLEIPYLLGGRNDPVPAIIGGPGSRWNDEVVFLREGRNTTVTILRREGLLRLYNDGRPESGFGPDEPGFGPELAVLGGLPTLFADRTDRAMVIGLGAGHTVTMLLAGGWRRIDVVELEEGIVEAARVLHEARGKPFPLDDQRTRLVVDDARAQLVLAPAGSYDAVVSQPSHPWLAGSSALYTREFFLEVRRALRPGGVLALWVNLFRMDVPHLRAVVATLLDVLPHAHAFVVEDSSFVLVAGAGPLRLDGRAAERLETDAMRPLLEPFELDELVDWAAVREMDERTLRAFGAGAPLIVDDRPALEFDLARMAQASLVTRKDLDLAVWRVPWIDSDGWRALPEPDRVEALLERATRCAGRRRALLRLRASLDELSPLAPGDRALVDGRIAELLGDVGAALAAWDAAASARAAAQADRLRHAERACRQALDVARNRSVVPDSARALLSCAAAVGSREAVQDALRIAEAAAAPEDQALSVVLRAWLGGGCETMLRAGTLRAVAANDEHVAWLAERCALRLGQLPMGLEFSELRARARRALAARESDAGLERLREGNRGLAIRHFRRSLAANPGYAPAASSLARLLVEIRRREEATELLRTALDASRGLRRSTDLIRRTAADLGLRLEPGAMDTAGRPSTTAPAAPRGADESEVDG